jgi:hypothetical protein
MALQQNRDQLKAMIAEKIKADRTTRHIGLIPFHDKIIEETSDIMLRVTLEVLADPRTDELISSMLQDNIAQLRSALREREEHPRTTARQDAQSKALRQPGGSRQSQVESTPVTSAATAERPAATAGTPATTAPDRA